MSIRARLALGSAFAVAVAIVAASAVVYFLVQKELRAQVDRNLESTASQIANTPRFAAYEAYPHIYVLLVPTPLSRGYFQLVDTDGNVYLPPGYAAPKPKLAVLARVSAVAKGSSGPFFYDAKVEGDDYRVFTRHASSVPPVAIQ